MLYRNLNNPNNMIANSAQDGKLISLLVELLNNTDSNLLLQNDSSDSEVDWWHQAHVCLDVCVCPAGWYKATKDEDCICIYVFVFIFVRFWAIEEMNILN